MRITRKGQVTIPKHIRDAVGLHVNSEAHFEVVEGGALIRPCAPQDWKAAFEEWLRDAPRNNKPFTPESIMTMTRGEG